MSFDPSNIDVEEFLEALDITVAGQTQYEVRFSCPFPGHSNGDATPSASMNKETTAFFCYTCKERGDAVYFAANLLGISPLEAIRLLRARYQPGWIDPDSVSMVDEIKRMQKKKELELIPQPSISEFELEKRAVDWESAYDEMIRGFGHPATDYMFGRGFAVETLNEWEIGYDTITGRLSIPVRDAGGELIGFKARAYDDRPPKYLVLGDAQNLESGRFGFKRYFPSRVVFGANRLGGEEVVVVCEGELNAISVTAKTSHPAVAINGSNFTEHHAKILRQKTSGVILYLDDDKAGQNAVWGYVDQRGDYHPGIIAMLKDHIPIYLVPDHEKDAADSTPEEIWALVENAESALLRSLKV